MAFSGKVKIDDQEYTESGMNNIAEDKLPAYFDTDEYQVLLVANKYQTGFDQPKLCAMYILKKLRGVATVQTLSRLNRTCHPYEKKTFVLDFVNTYDDVKKAFAPYYTTTLLANTVTPSSIYELESKIDAYMILNPLDIEQANTLLYKKEHTDKDRKGLTFLFSKAKQAMDNYSEEEQREIVALLRRFVRFYEFLLQVSCFEDVELHKKYNFISYLLAYVNIRHSGNGYNLAGKLQASNFVQKKKQTIEKPGLKPDPIVNLPVADTTFLTPDKEEKLSKIIEDINSRTGMKFDKDVAVKAMLQIKDILLKSEILKTSAKNNTVANFSFPYFEEIDKALIDGISQNQDFFSLLLNNEELKKEVLSVFTDEIYKTLRQQK